MFDSCRLRSISETGPSWSCKSGLSEVMTGRSPLLMYTRSLRPGGALFRASLACRIASTLQPPSTVLLRHAINGPEPGAAPLDPAAAFANVGVFEVLPKRGANEFTAVRS